MSTGPFLGCITEIPVLVECNSQRAGNTKVLAGLVAVP